MSEKLHHGSEHSGESIRSSAESEKNLERLREVAEKAADKDPLQKHIESIRQSVAAEAVSGKERSASEQQTGTSGHTFGIHKELKVDAYKKTMRRVQNKLPPPEKVLSRVIHQPVVDAVSNATAKTVARPSGFLGGSIVAFIGSAVFLYMARRYGFTYNYAVVFMLFVGGFLAGIILELIIRFLFRNRASS